MGSFTSMPKAVPAADPDDEDVAYSAEKETVEDVLAKCEKNLAGQPAPIERVWVPKAVPEAEAKKVRAGEKVRVLQWNVLSQGKCILRIPDAQCEGCIGIIRLARKE